MFRNLYLIVLALLVSPALAWGQYGTGDGFVSAGKVSGVLTSRGGSQTTLTLRVQSQQVEPNPQGMANLARQRAQMGMRYQQIMRNPNPFQRQAQLAQMMAQLQQAQRNLYRVRQIQQNLNFNAADDMKVRTLQPPLAYDEKGNPKRWTASELRELKGEDKLPGYMADLDALRTGQLVTVYLAKRRTQPGNRPTVDAAFLPDNQPVVKVIVIVAEPQS